MTWTAYRGATNGINQSQLKPDMARALRDAVQRGVRVTRPGLMVLILHLSRLQPPAPTPYHRLIARAALDAAASREQGQVFALANGDFALLYRPSTYDETLMASLSELFVADVGSSMLLSYWALPEGLAELNSYLDTPATTVAGPDEVEQDRGLAEVTKLFGSLDQRRIRELLERQMGVRVALGQPGRMIPVYREVRVSLPALQARAPAGSAVSADPYLLRHFMSKLDYAMLAATAFDLSQDRSTLSGLEGEAVALHVVVSLDDTSSQAFSALADAAERRRARIVVEVPLLEAYAETDAFFEARSRLQEQGFSLVLSGVTYSALLTTRIAALSFDWLKLDWSPRMLQSNEQFDQVLQEIDPAKVILHRVDTANAVTWAINRKILRFQGRYIDSVLAASRLAICPEAKACSLRTCVDQAKGMTQATRAACRNLSLLDSTASNLG